MTEAAACRVAAMAPRVLLVSNAVFRRPLLTLAAGLVRGGHCIAFAWDRAGAERLMRDHPPAVIIVDSELEAAAVRGLPAAAAGARRPRVVILGSPARVNAVLRAASRELRVADAVTMGTPA